MVGFFTLFMLSLGKSDAHLLASLAGLLSSGAVAYAILKFLNARRDRPVLLCVVTLMLVSLTGFLASSIPLFLVAAAVLVFILQDLCSINAFSSLKQIADQTGHPEQRVVATSLLLLMVISLVASPLMGAFFDLGLEVGVLVCIVVGAVILGAIYRRPTSALPFPEIRKARSSLDEHLYCALSMMYNLSNQVGHYYLTPIIVSKIAQAEGLNGNVFMILGLITGAATILALLSKKANKFSSDGLVKYGYAGGILSMLGMVAVFIVLDKGIIESNLWLTLVFLCMVALQHIFSRLWNAGFVVGLSEKSRDGNNSQIAHKKLLSLFTVYRNLGGAFGFSLALLMLIFCNVAYGIVLTGIISIAYLTFFRWREDRKIPCGVYNN